MVKAAARAGSVLVAALLAVASALLAGVVGGSLTGAWRLAPVRSGSMAPTMPAGALVVSTPAPAQAVRPGWVITFHRPVDRAVVTHRVVRVITPGPRPVVETKGDANPAPDPWRLRLLGERVWRARVVVPLAGRALLALRARPVRLAITAGVPLVLGLWLAAEVLSGRTPAASQPRSRRPRVRPGRPRRCPAPAPAAPTPAWCWSRSADDLLPARRPSSAPPHRRSAALAAAAAVVVTVGFASTAHASIGDSAAVQQSTITTDTLLSPTGLSATGGCAGLLQGPKVDLTWTPTTSTYATGYTVWRATSSGGPYTKVADVAGRATSSWTDTSVQLNRTYWYSLQAVYAAWTSADSTPASATTPLLCL